MPYAKTEAGKTIKIETPPTAPPAPPTPPAPPAPPAIPTWVIPLAIAAVVGAGIAVYLAYRR
jgi:hypothetical protein